MLAPRRVPHCPCTGPSLAAPGDPPRVAWVEHGHSMVPTAVGTPRAQGRAAPTQAPRRHGSGPPSGPHPPRDTGPCPAPSSSGAPIRGGEFAPSGTALSPPPHSNRKSAKHILPAFQKGGLKLERTLGGAMTPWPSRGRLPPDPRWLPGPRSSLSSVGPWLPAVWGWGNGTLSRERPFSPVWDSACLELLGLEHLRAPLYVPFLI